MPITVAMRSKALTVFASKNNGVVGSNLTRSRGIFLCLFCVYCPVCPLQGILPNVHKIKEIEKATKAQQRVVEP
jgi:hypothetical protein